MAMIRQMEGKVQADCRYVQDLLKCNCAAKLCLKFTYRTIPLKKNHTVGSIDSLVYAQNTLF